MGKLYLAMTLTAATAALVVVVFLTGTLPAEEPPSPEETVQTEEDPKRVIPEDCFMVEPDGSLTPCGEFVDEEMFPS